MIEPKSDAGFVMTASRRNFGDKFGLKLETLSLKNGQIALKALLAGEIDSAETGAGEAIIAAAAGADVKIIGCNWPGLPHAVFVKSDIADVQGLKGKTIAASAPGSLPDLLIRSLLEKSSIPMADVRIASLGGDLDRYKALTAGVVDAAVISSEYVPIAPKTVRLMLAGRDVIPELHAALYRRRGQDRAGPPGRGGAIPGGGDRRGPLRGLAPGRDRRADPRGHGDEAGRSAAGIRFR